MTTTTAWWRRRSINRRGRGRLGQEASPLVEGPVAGQPETAPLVGRGDEPEEQLGAGEVQRRKAQLIQNDQVHAQETVDELAHRVVGQPAVEGLDEIGRGEVADAQAGLDSGVTEADQQMGLAGTGRSHQDEVLLGPDPFE